MEGDELKGIYKNFKSPILVKWPLSDLFNSYELKDLCLVVCLYIYVSDYSFRHSGVRDALAALC